MQRWLEDLLAKTCPDNGARSLSAVTVVVPTVQAGRRVRLALARAAGGGIIPPKVVLPGQLLVAADDPRLANRSEELVAMMTACGKSLTKAAQLLELRYLLFEKSLSFADVAALAGDLDDRWEGMAELETRYYGELDKFGKTDRIALAKAAAPMAAVVRLDDIPALVEHTPAPLLQREQIIACGNAESEAAQIAAYFAAVGKHESLPALCVADPDMFPLLKSAFEAKGLKLHDPSRTPLASSSLGRLVRQLIAMQRTRSYAVFSAFIRGGDARRWIAESLQLDEAKYTAALVDLDNRQQELLPEKIDDIATKTSGTLRAIFEFVGKELRKKGPRQLLSAIFRNYILNDEDAGVREFAAAAECLNALIDEVEGATTDERLRLELFERRLEETGYSLEPDEGEIVMAEGWLDLPFVEAREIVIAGFQEGRVPESTVGHPYLPDSLRTRLGLTDNARRTARDRAILSIVTGSRESAAVKVCFHCVNDQGDVVKPSRLLFEGTSDEELIARVKEFYGHRPGSGLELARDMPDGWKLSLPIPPPYRELTKISPTRLDSYLRCPFTYYLRDKEILGDKRLDDRAEELASWEYGNLAHEALEAFGLSELKDADDMHRIADFLEARVDEQLVERFGMAIPAIVAMQGESVKRRLRNFATVQAEHRRQGWRIFAVERKLEVAYDHTRVYGKCDRIDRHEVTGELLVIDYKTWDSAGKAESYDAKKQEWKSLQLPLYCAMLDCDCSPEFAASKLENISACYCVLGKNADEVRFSMLMSGGMVSDAECKVRELIARIERGIFWPPSPTKEWQWDYEDWLGEDPRQGVAASWIADQESRL